MMGAGRMGYYGSGLDIFGLFFFIFWIFSFIDVVLLAFYLFKQIQKKQ